MYICTCIHIYIYIYMYVYIYIYTYETSTHGSSNAYKTVNAWIVWATCTIQSQVRFQSQMTTKTSKRGTSKHKPSGPKGRSKSDWSIQIWKQSTTRNRASEIQEDWRHCKTHSPKEAILASLWKCSVGVAQTAKVNLLFSFFDPSMVPEGTPKSANWNGWGGPSAARGSNSARNLY